MVRLQAGPGTELETRNSKPATAPASLDYSELEKDFPYSAIDTCATDGLCATACSVCINTGELVKHFRRTRQTASTQQWAARIATHFAATESVLRWSLPLGHAAHALIGANADRSSWQLIKSLFGDNALKWKPDTPHAAGPVPSTSRAGAQGRLLSVLYLADNRPASRRAC